MSIFEYHNFFVCLHFIFIFKKKKKKPLQYSQSKIGMLGTGMCCVEAFSRQPLIDNCVLRKIDLHLQCHDRIKLEQLIKRIHFF